MTSLAVAVVTTEGRERYLEAMLDSVADGRVHIVKDAARGLTPNHLAAWMQLISHGTTHCLLFQDQTGTQPPTSQQRSEPSTEDRRHLVSDRCSTPPRARP